MIQDAPIYQHTKRPEWGYGAVVETRDDRTTFGFDDGSSRTILHNHIHMMSQVELEDPEASEVRKRIAKHWAPKTRTSKATVKTKRKKSS